ncbi:MAG: histidinol dehydrogenase [Oscillospiraceae bacterium]|nr:histidinol dehydrogenase [Oscillospiraceae bacterium]
MKIIYNQQEIQAFMDSLETRGGITSGSGELALERTVRSVIKDVKEKGDDAVRRYTARFDCDNPKYYRVPEVELIRTYRTYKDNEQEFIAALKRCYENITAFHRAQKKTGYTLTEESGVITGQRVRPLDTVGIYVPGGNDSLFSSVMMCAIPAKIAGVKRIVMTTPPRKDGTANPDLLATAKLCGINEIYLCGGAQAIAAMAFGTEEIPKVDKIVGPGNVYVTAAKKLLFGIIDIDMIAGPSEMLIIADKSANPVYIAADLLSQAEHDKIASSVLITDSKEIAEKTLIEVERQLEDLPRKDSAKLSLEQFGAIIIVKNMDEAVRISEEIAPERLEVMTENPLEYIGRLNNVGSLFLGAYSPEPLGDYFAGPNHVLPTSGTARFFSPLNVDMYTKKTSYIYYPQSALKNAAEDVIMIAEREDLEAHANAVRIRVENC